MSELSQLFEFLSSPNPAARQIALKNLIGHTPKNDPQRDIFIPSAFAAAPGDTAQKADGGGLQPNKRKEGAEQDDAKVKAIQDLANLCRDQAAIAHDALSALINLTDSLAVSRQLMQPDFLVWLMSYTANATSPLSPLTAMLLSNLTSHVGLVPQIANLAIPVVSMPKSTHYPPYYLPACASSSSTIHPDFRDPGFVPANAEVGQEPVRDVEGVRALVAAFEDGASDGIKDGKGKRKGDVNFLASVFANISMLPATRNLLLTPMPAFPAPSTARTPDDEPLLAKIVVYTEHPDTIRRGGALGTIKNCAMERGTHPWLLAREDERVKLPTDDALVRGVDVLPYVLGPLMGPEEYDMDEMETLPETLQFLGPEKKREQDPVLRMMCVEILLLLATSYTGRETLRARGAYYVVREAHKAEGDQGIREAIERLVSLLQGEEGRDSRKDTIDALVKTVQAPSGAVAPADAAAGLREAEAAVEAKGEAAADAKGAANDEMDVVEV